MRVVIPIAILLLPLSGCMTDGGNPIHSIGEPEYGEGDAGGAGDGGDGDTTPSDGPEEGGGVPGTAFRPVWSGLEGAKLRPGSQMPVCTFDWLFADPVTGAYYVGIAAHCTDDIGQNVSLVGHGEIGTVVFDSDNGTLQEGSGIDEGVDFSLIRLHDDVNRIAHPQMLGFDGPSGFVTCDEVVVGESIGFHGYGVGVGQLEPTRARQGILSGCDGQDYGAQTAAIYGDSGAAVLHLPTGKALGIVSRLGLDHETPSELTGATLPYIFQELEKAGFGGVMLATADGGLVGSPDAA